MGAPYIQGPKDEYWLPTPELRYAVPEGTSTLEMTKLQQLWKSSLTEATEWRDVPSEVIPRK